MKRGFSGWLFLISPLRFFKLSSYLALLSFSFWEGLVKAFSKSGEIGQFRRIDPLLFYGFRDQQLRVFRENHFGEEIFFLEAPAPLGPPLRPPEGPPEGVPPEEGPERDGYAGLAKFSLG